MAKKIIVKIFDIDIPGNIIGADPEIPGSGTHASLAYVLNKVVEDGCADAGFSFANKSKEIIVSRISIDKIYEVTE